MYRRLERLAESPLGQSEKVRRYGRILYESVLSFRTNQVPVRAAALTFATLLSVVPLFTIGFAAAKKLGYLDLLTGVLPAVQDSFGVNLPLDRVEEVIENAQKIHFGALGIAGIVGLFVTYVLALTNLEKAMNIVWGIRKPRSLFKRLRIYFPFLLFLLFFAGVLAWMLVKLRDYLDALVNQALGIGMYPQLRFGGVYAALGVLAWLFVAVLFYLIPNTRVRVRSAVFGSVVAVLFYLIPNTRVRVRSAVFGSVVAVAALGAFFWATIVLQARMFTNFSVLYGSLAIFPFLMVVLYVSWILVLYGVTLAYAHQKERL